MSTLYAEQSALHSAWDMARDLVSEKMGIVGYGIVHVRDEIGRTKELVPFANLITDAGDLYYATQAIYGVQPANSSSHSAGVAVVMKLGTGATAAAKNSTGGALGAYISGSNQAFDSPYPQVSNLGAGLGVNAVYKTTWAAGSATNSAITEAVIANSNADATATGANTYSRVTFTAVNKGSNDTLAITWNHKFLGS